MSLLALIFRVYSIIKCSITKCCVCYTQFQSHRYQTGLPYYYCSGFFSSINQQCDRSNQSCVDNICSLSDYKINILTRVNIKPEIVFAKNLMCDMYAYRAIITFNVGLVGVMI